jgi:hypothetical protein
MTEPTTTPPEPAAAHPVPAQPAPGTAAERRERYAAAIEPNMTCALYEPAEAGPYPEHPGWPESCLADPHHDLTAGLRTGCPQWEPPPQQPHEDGHTPA